MKYKNNLIFNLNPFITLLAIIITIVGCKEDALEDHYEQQDARLESSILSVLSEDANYSTFVQLIKKTGFEELLQSSQAFTVWAPDNEAMSLVPDAVLNDEDALKALIGNHISRFSYNSTIPYNTELDNNSVLVQMFNDKFVEFTNADGQVTFGDVDVVEIDGLTANGLLHKVSSVLSVSPNIWDFINDNGADFPALLTYFEKTNEITFDEQNSVRIGENSLGQTVYDSVFVTSNSRFGMIGDLGSESERYTFVGLTDAAYTGIYDRFKEFYQFPIEDEVRKHTDSIIFNNLNFPAVDLDDLDGLPIRNTLGNEVVLDVSSVSESISLSNGNVFVMDPLNYEAKNVMYKPIRYEIENTERRDIGDLSDFTIVQKFENESSGRFTNTVSLLANPDGNESNNYFEIAFSNVLSASYNINLKFSQIGAALKTKLKFEFSYVDENNNTVVNEIDAIEVEPTEEGVITIGDIYDIPVFINDKIDNNYFVKLKVIVDVSEAELIIYDRKFGIDYAELTPVE
ncbi:MAG: fasciclin domain-containing protein [Algibacter sp.]